MRMSTLPKSYLAFYLFFLPGLCRGQDDQCLAARVRDNVVEFTTPYFPEWFSTKDCQCVVTTSHDLEFDLHIKVQDQGYEDKQCKVNLFELRRNQMLSFCGTGPDEVYEARMALSGGENVTFTLTNPQMRYIKLNVIMSASQKDAELTVECTGDIGRGVWDSASSAAARGTDNMAKGAITGAMIGVVIIVLLITLTLIGALIKMNIDKARLRKRKKEHMSKSLSNMDDNPGFKNAADPTLTHPKLLDNGYTPHSMNPNGPVAGAGDIGFANIGYVPSGPSMATSTRGSSPAGFADLGGVAMGSSLPNSVKGSTASIGSFFGNPGYGSRSSLPETEIRPIQPATWEPSSTRPAEGALRPIPRLPIQAAPSPARTARTGYGSSGVLPEDTYPNPRSSYLYGQDSPPPSPHYPYTGPSESTSPKPHYPYRDPPNVPTTQPNYPYRGPQESSSSRHSGDPAPIGHHPENTPSYPYRGPSEQPIQPSTETGTAYPTNTRPAQPGSRQPPGPMASDPRHPQPAQPDLRQPSYPTPADNPRQPSIHVQPSPLDLRDFPRREHSTDVPDNSNNQRPPIEVTRIPSDDNYPSPISESRIPSSAIPLTNIPRQPPLPAGYNSSPFNRNFPHIDSDVESSRFATAPTSPWGSPTEPVTRRGHVETTI